MGEGGDAEVAPLEYHVDEPGVFEVRPGQVGFREPGAEQFGVSGIDLREVAADLGRLDMSLVCQQIPFKLMKIRGHPWRRRHGNVWAEASQKGTRRS